MTDEDTSIDFGTAVNEVDNDGIAIKSLVHQLSSEPLSNSTRNLFRIYAPRNYFGASPSIQDPRRWHSGTAMNP